MTGDVEGYSSAHNLIVVHIAGTTIVGTHS